MSIQYDTRKWKDLGISEKVKLTVASVLVLSSLVLGFISFIILLEIPTSVIGLDGLWLSTALAILGIASHFHNEMIKFEANVQKRLNNIGKNNDDEIFDARHDKEAMQD